MGYQSLVPKYTLTSKRQLDEARESEDMVDNDDTVCPNCNNKIEFYSDQSYKGIRGRCRICKTNWPAS